MFTPQIIDRQTGKKKVRCAYDIGILSLIATEKIVFPS